MDCPALESSASHRAPSQSGSRSFGCGLSPPLCALRLLPVPSARTPKGFPPEPVPATSPAVSIPESQPVPQSIGRALQRPQRVGEPRPNVFPSRYHVLTQLHQLDSHHRAEETAKIWSPARAFVMSLVWVHAAAFRTTHRPTAESNTSVCL